MASSDWVIPWALYRMTCHWRAVRVVLRKPPFLTNPPLRSGALIWALWPRSERVA